jgi:hypothetical protein
MASSGKKKTTMSKLNRERKLRERRLDKQFRKDARKQAAIDGPPPGDEPLLDEDGNPLPADEEHEPEGALLT